MYYELFYLSNLRNYLDKVVDFLIGILLIDPQSTLNCYGDVNRLLHLFAYLSHQGRIKHQYSPKAIIASLLRGTPTVDVHLIVAPLLAHFGCFCHLLGVVAANLADHGVLVVTKGQEGLAACTGIEDGMLVQHLGVEVTLFR